jgi:CubicO group peptidase (beta-lactamase class C family)
MMSIARYLFIILLLPFFGAGQDSTAIIQLVNAYQSQQKFNGTVLVAKGGKIILAKGFGIRSNGLPNTVNTIFQIGSVTKQMTAEVILLLQKEGKLSVHDNLTRYVPGFAHGDSITIENLLTHTSGIFNYTNDSRFMATEATKPITRERLLSLFEHKPLEFAPGSSWSYSNSNYILLGLIIEQVSGLTYEQAMRKYIFTPLKMNRSGFDFTHLSDQEKATGYFNLYSNPPVAATIVDSSVAFAAGAVYTTVTDLYKWHVGLQQNKLLSSKDQEAAFRPFLNHYGYGVSADTLFGKRMLAHGGGIYGFTSFFTRVSSDNICVILLSNTGSNVLEEINKKILSVIYKQPYELPKSKPQVELPVDSMRQFVGQYKLGSNFDISVTIDGGSLYGQATGQPKFQLFPLNNTRFYLKAVEAEVEFFRNDTGTIDHLVLYQGGTEVKGQKVK